MKRTFASRTFASRTFASANWVGVAVAVTVPDQPGLEFTIPVNRMHYTMPTNRMHHMQPVNRLHFTMAEED